MTVTTITCNNVTYMCPFADLLRPLTAEERSALTEDIQRHGVLVPVLVDEDHNVIDGHNRLEIAAELGVTSIPIQVLPGLTSEEKRDRAEELNLRRRHLSREDIRLVLARRLKANPEQSDRAIAGEVHVDHKTVGAARRTLEATGDIPQVPTTRGADGKTRRRRRSDIPPESSPDPNPLPAHSPQPSDTDEGGQQTRTTRKGANNWPNFRHHKTTLQVLVRDMASLRRVRVAERNPEDVHHFVGRIRTLADAIEREVANSSATAL